MTNFDQKNTTAFILKLELKKQVHKIYMVNQQHLKGSRHNFDQTNTQK